MARLNSVLSEHILIQQNVVGLEKYLVFYFCTQLLLKKISKQTNKWLLFLLKVSQHLGQVEYAEVFCRWFFFSIEAILINLASQEKEVLSDVEMMYKTLLRSSSFFFFFLFP